MWRNIQFFIATVAVFAIVTVQNVQSQTPIECTAYLSDTEPNSPLAAMLKVNNGSRLKFVYKESDVNKSACHEKYKGWHVNGEKIDYNYRTNNISVNVSFREGICVYEFNITFSPTTNVTQSRFIYFQPDEYCVTYKICSRNVTANYIYVILENESSKQTTLPAPTTTQSIAPPLTYPTFTSRHSTPPPSTSPLPTSESCPNCDSIATIKELQSNLSSQIKSECKKLDTKWQYTLLGVELLSLVFAFFTGIISTAICCKLEQKQPLDQPATQFSNPTYQGGVMDTNLKAQSDNSLTQNINQEITHSHSSLTTDSH